MVYSNLAFISYARRSDAALAGRLQSDLERYAVPLGLKCNRTILAKNKYLRPIFRDHTDLNLHNPSWDAQLVEELQRSRYLILICSPGAAGSANVNKEVQTFLDSHKNDSSLILPIISSGNVTAVEGESVCLPPALRPHRTALISRNLPLVRECKGPELMLKTAAWILQVDYPVIHRQFRHQQSRRLKTVLAVSFVAVLLSASLLWKIRNLANEKKVQQVIAEKSQETAKQKSYVAKIRQVARAISQEQLDLARSALNDCQPLLRDWEWYHLKAELDQSLIQIPTASAVSPAAVCEANHRLAVLTPDFAIQIISLYDLKEVGRFPIRVKDANTIAWSADAQWLAVGSWTSQQVQGEVVVFEAESGKEMWRKETGAVLQMTFSRDGLGLFVSVPNYGAIQQFDAETGEDASPALGMNGLLAGRFALSDEEDYLAALDYDGRKLTLFEINDGRELWNISIAEATDRAYFADVDISKDGKYVIAATDRIGEASFGDGFWLIDAATGKKKEGIGDDLGRAVRCLFSPSDSQIGIARPDGAIECFTYFPLVGKANPLRRFSPHNISVSAITIWGHLILSSGTDGVIRSDVTVYDSPPSHFRGHTQRVIGIQGLPRDPEQDLELPDFLSWADDNTVRIWSLQRSVMPIGRTGLTENDVKMGAQIWTYSPDGKSAIVRGTGLHDSIEFVGKARVRLDHPAWVIDIAFADDGSRALTGSRDGSAKVWNMEDGSLVTSLAGGNGAVGVVALDADGSLAVTGSGDQKVRLWNAITGELMQLLEGHAGEVTEVCFSRDGKWIASGNTLGKIIIWNVAEGSRRCLLAGLDKPIVALDFSPDSKYLLSAAADGPAQIWDIQGEASLAELTTPGPLADVVYNRAGSRVFTLGTDGNLGVWDPKQQELIMEFPLALRQAVALQFTVDGSVLMINDVRGDTIRLLAPVVTPIANRETE